jgi:predicted NBD/HSP70 family sugar kinase
MTRNEKKILTAVSRYGPLTRRELGQKARISWSTTVKMVARLEAAGFLRQVGVSQRRNVQGRDSAVYDLSDSMPLALGIDIEYATTRVLLTNLKDDVLHTEAYPTPQVQTMEELADFASGLVQPFLGLQGRGTRQIAGAGVVLPAFLIRSGGNPFAVLQQRLQERLPVAVRVDDVVRAYTLYKERRLYTSESFIMLTVRSGIGVGISLNGHLFRGDDNLAGELSHVVMDPNGSPCPRCGNRGCFETLINENVLYERYTGVVSAPLPDHADYDSTGLRAGLSDLFGRAARGEAAAAAIVAEAAETLARGLAILLNVLDVSRVYMAGHFGRDGQVLVPRIEEALARYLTPMVSRRIAYEPLQDLGFPLGACLLILRDYCDYEID